MGIREVVTYGGREKEGKTHSGGKLFGSKEGRFRGGGKFDPWGRSGCIVKNKNWECLLGRQDDQGGGGENIFL